MICKLCLQKLTSKKPSLIRKSIVWLLNLLKKRLGLSKKKLGDHAKVVSVRQIGGEGLKRFISSPKLEVIAELSSPQSDAQPSLPEDNQLSTSPPQLSNSSTEESKENHPNLESVPLPLENPNQDLGDGDGISDLLQKTGFDENLLSQIKSWTNWSEIKELSLADALTNYDWIVRSLQIKHRSSLTNTVALIGTSVSGKTTTLCKVLANEVFINKKVPMVLKIENGVPNPDDSLRIFCEVIVTLFKKQISFLRLQIKLLFMSTFPVYPS